MTPALQSLRRAAWYKRAHAALLARANRHYEHLVAERKRGLLGALRGTVVEIGPGTGANLQYYDASVRWVGIEPNRFAHGYIRREAAERGIVPDVRDASAEALPFADASVDAVVSTLVLCSVAEVGPVLREAHRVLRAGGRFIFVEHVAAPRGSWTRRLQRGIRPLWAVIADGCHPDRESWHAIAAAGFSRVHLERFRLSLPVVGPHIAGWAEK